jgi:hypothetical protein
VRRTQLLGRLGTALGLAGAVVLSGPVAPIARAAPGCPASQPTFVGGRIEGHTDRHAVNAFIGVNHKDSAGRRVDVNGRPCDQGGSCGPGYAWTEAVNPSLSPGGSTSPTADRSWGRCVGRGVALVTVEIYPKSPSGVTDKSRYGSAAHFNQRVTAGGTNSILLRLPVTYAAAGGNTGAVNGYLRWYGTAVPPRYVTRMRAFPVTNGPVCGVEGFSASADVLATGASGATYYRLDHLAAGQCGAPRQRYVIQADCRTFCGTSVRSLRRYADVVRGRGTRLDLSF